MKHIRKLVSVLAALALILSCGAMAEEFELAGGLRFGMTAEEAIAAQAELGIEVIGNEIGERIYYSGDGAGAQEFGQELLYVGFRTHDEADALQYVIWEFSDSQSYEAVAEELEKAYGPLNDIAADGFDIMNEVYTGNLKMDENGNYRQEISAVFNEESGMIKDGFAMYLIPAGESYALVEHCQFHFFESEDSVYYSHYVSFLLLSDEAVETLTRDGLIK